MQNKLKKLFVGDKCGVVDVLADNTNRAAGSIFTGVDMMNRCRASMPHMKQSRLGSGLGSQVKFSKIIKFLPRRSDAAGDLLKLMKMGPYLLIGVGRRSNQALTRLNSVQNPVGESVFFQIEDVPVACENDLLDKKTE